MESRLDAGIQGDNPYGCNLALLAENLTAGPAAGRLVLLGGA